MFPKWALLFDTVLEMIACFFCIQVAAAAYFLEFCLCVILCKAVLIDPSSPDKFESGKKNDINKFECVTQSTVHYLYTQHTHALLM